jgi:phospholipid/cholesterol/gamma-HCH transport system substrate-binding protein
MTPNEPETNRLDQPVPASAPGRWLLPRRVGDAARRRLAAVRALPPPRRWALGAGVLVVVAGLITGGVLLYDSFHQGKHITAYFTEAIGIFPGSDVRILGVPVGTVDSVQPAGTEVKVTMTIDQGIAVPADARAAVIVPSVVADRYVQLLPAYSGGPQLGNGATIPVSRTAVPAEVDQIFASLNKFVAELGPNGVNKHGALSNLIKTGAANLSGNGQYLNAMISQYGALSEDLGSNAGNLFATLDYLQQFTTMLKNNDGQVRLAEQQLASVFGFLAADRQDLSGALSNLSTALGQVQGFIASNRSLIKSNVARLASITQLLVKERASLAEAMDDVPLDADNVVAAYDSATRTLTGRGDLNELCLGPDAAELGCGTTTSAATSGSATGLTADADAAVPAGSLPADGVTGLPPLPLPAIGLAATPEALLAAVTPAPADAAGRRS